jgi:hypothetical protein
MANFSFISLSLMKDVVTAIDMASVSSPWPNG